MESNPVYKVLGLGVSPMASGCSTPARGKAPWGELAEVAASDSVAAPPFAPQGVSVESRHGQWL